MWSSETVRKLTVGKRDHPHKGQHGTAVVSFDHHGDWEGLLEFSGQRPEMRDILLNMKQL